ncbi:hypothetical protein NE857_30895 [Nocardiopsis exhalans]|uniref:ScoMcrA-like SRA domain-containing protein n=1 Tax=Nocardiopsis exhalans TaxID=163604 RepID=A0ABY5D774_9ACTN|nr:hypothetical protein [Nocardiopsis exhalans]USY19596.1 hypothetical protein NE857_30895 [Nocardiopsis exhalans]
MPDKNIRPGDFTTRMEMKAVFGGGQGMGIHPSSSTPNILLYTDPASGEQWGYYDGWAPTDDDTGPIFEYTGDGDGDQVFKGRHGQRNRAILMHIDDGRDLRLFKADGKVPGTGTKRQRYIGRFELDATLPYIVRQAPNSKGEFRRVIVFRLRPIEALEATERDSIIPLPKTEALPVPADLTTSALVEPESNHGGPISRSAQPRTGVDRREASLCDEFRGLLEEHEREVKRFQIRVSGLSSSLLTDLYDADSHVLYEAKGTSSRESVRMAIGQLMDYRRHVTPTDPTLAVLLPQEPHPDLRDLLDSVNIGLVYQIEGSFKGWK